MWIQADQMSIAAPISARMVAVQRGTGDLTVPGRRSRSCIMESRLIIFSSKLTNPREMGTSGTRYLNRRPQPVDRERTGGHGERPRGHCPLILPDGEPGVDGEH